MNNRNAFPPAHNHYPRTTPVTGVPYPKEAHMVTHPMEPGTYTVSSGYGSRWGAFHAGLDFA